MRYALAILALLAAGEAQAADCGIAKVLFGGISIAPIGRDGEALVRHSGFDTQEPEGAIRGTITVGRGNLEVHDRDGAVVGQIEPSTGRIIGFDDVCDKSHQPRYKSVEKDIGIIINGEYPVGMVKGKLPR